MSWDNFLEKQLSLVQSLANLPEHVQTIRLSILFPPVFHNNSALLDLLCALQPAVKDRIRSLIFYVTPYPAGDWLRRISSFLESCASLRRLGFLFLTQTPGDLRKLVWKSAYRNAAVSRNSKTSCSTPNQQPAPHSSPTSPLCSRTLPRCKILPLLSKKFTL